MLFSPLYIWDRTLKLTVWHGRGLARFLHFVANGSQCIVDAPVVADDSLVRAFPDANRITIPLLPACPPFENVKAKLDFAVSAHNGLMSMRRYASHHLRLHSVQSIS
jgi:hypothetical protein